HQEHEAGEIQHARPVSDFLEPQVWKWPSFLYGPGSSRRSVVGPALSRASDRGHQVGDGGVGVECRSVPPEGGRFTCLRVSISAEEVWTSRTFWTRAFSFPAGA